MYEMSKSTLFSLQIFTTGASEKMFEWIKEGMPISSDSFCKYLFEAMPYDIQRVSVSYKMSKQEIIYMTKLVAQKCEADKKGYMSYKMDPVNRTL